MSPLSNNDEIKVLDEGEMRDHFEDHRAFDLLFIKKSIRRALFKLATAKIIDGIIEWLGEHVRDLLPNRVRSSLAGNWGKITLVGIFVLYALLSNTLFKDLSNYVGVREAIVLTFTAAAFIPLTLLALYLRWRYLRIVKISAEIAKNTAATYFELQSLPEKGELKSTVERLEKTLVSLLKRFNPNYYFDFYKVKYVITPNGNDQWTRDFQICPEDEVIAVTSVKFGATGPGSGIEDFYTLKIEGFTSKNEVIGFDNIVDLIPKKGKDEVVWEGALLFKEPITPASGPRRVRIRGEWPGLWDKLREQGKDEGKFELRRFSKYLQITLAFPKGIKGEDVKIASIPPHAKISKAFDDLGRLEVKILIEDAGPGVYYYEVECENLRLQAHLNKASHQSRH